jgi:formylglycine-generating enzyme required for sulfatase activity
LQARGVPDALARARRLAPLALAAGLACPPVLASDRVTFPGFALDRTEVTVDRFRDHLARAGTTTAAERAGGGHEYAGGWQRRSGWVWHAPQGVPAAPAEPVAHVTWEEARTFCAAAGGRLPTLAEWRQAAFTELRDVPTDGFERGRTYTYPVGDRPEGMNYNRRHHVPAGTTRRGVNGLFDMGANVWEWVADRRGDEALTVGGSWWYGPEQARASGPQWKRADFHALYIGFRCVYGTGG